MNTQWKDFLQSEGAEFASQHHITTFGHPEIEQHLMKDGPIVSPFVHQSIILVQGEDATSFLQGQLTNDIQLVNGQQGQIAAWCDPKGQVVALFRIFAWDDGYLLLCHASLAEVLVKRLKMFVMRSKVQVTLSEDLVAFGYGGFFAEQAVQRYLDLSEFNGIYSVQSATTPDYQGVKVMEIPGPYKTYILVGEVAPMQEAWQALRHDSEAVGTANWQLLDIVMGIPQITAATSGQFLAQFLNLDRLDAINFKKGCYTGQEMIAKTHYRGEAQKRLYRMHLRSETLPSPGEEIHLSDSEGGNTKAQVISAEKDVIGGILALMVISNKAIEKSNGRFKTQQGDGVFMEPLPYKLFD